MRSSPFRCFPYLGAAFLSIPVNSLSKFELDHGSSHGRPRVEIERPRPIINELKIAVERAPNRSAIWAMIMPPAPEPNRASVLASAGTERAPPTSLAMSLSATAMIQAALNDIARMKSRAEATTYSYRGSVLTPFHEGPTSPSKHHFLLSCLKIKPDRSVRFLWLERRNGCYATIHLFIRTGNATGEEQFKMIVTDIEGRLFALWV